MMRNVHTVTCRLCLICMVVTNLLLSAAKAKTRDSFDIAGLLLLAAKAGTQDSFDMAAGGGVLYGPVDGVLQTLNGGTEATTSHRRPTLDELGIDQTSSVDFWMDAHWRRHGLYGGGRLIRFSGEDTLEVPLLSQSKTFPAGALVEADVKFDWYRLGYRYRIPCEWDDRTVEFYPSVGFAIMDFHYQLSSSGLDDVDRSYSKGGIQVGLGVDFPVTNKLGLSARVLWPVALSNCPEIYSAQLAVKYLILERKDLAVSGLLGIAYDEICYEDNQDEPNHVELEMGPMLLASVLVNF